MYYRLLAIILALSVVGCTIKKQRKTVSPTQALVYYTGSENRISFSILKSSIPNLHIKNQSFEYSFSLERLNAGRQNKQETQSSVVYINYLEDYVEGEMYPQFSMQAGDSIRVNLITSNNVVLHSGLVIIPNKNAMQIKLVKGKQKIAWGAPFLTTSNVYELQGKRFYYELESQSFNNLQNKPIQQTTLFSDSVCTLKPQTEGLYLFYSDSAKTNFLYSIPVGSANFPKCNSPKEMLQNLQIIFPNINTDSLCNTEKGAKLELDKIWLQTCKGNEIQAKKCISEYYSRIETANNMFTTHCWLGMYSDQGKAYILFGKPESTHSNNVEEVWYYSTDKSNLAKQIQFAKIKLPFCTQFSVKQTTAFVEKSQQALLNWQKGRIFTLLL